jgi:hypothetical protein
VVGGGILCFCLGFIDDSQSLNGRVEPVAPSVPYSQFAHFEIVKTNAG